MQSIPHLHRHSKRGWTWIWDRPSGKTTDTQIEIRMYNIYIYMHAYSMHSARLSMYWVWNLDNPCIWNDFSDESVCCRIVLGYIAIPSQAQGNVKSEFEHKSTNWAKHKYHRWLVGHEIEKYTTWVIGDYELTQHRETCFNQVVYVI